MNKRAVLELTPLLDVILIILFAVIINVSQSNIASVKDKEILKEELMNEVLKYEIEKSKNEKLNEALYQLLSKDKEKFDEIIKNIYESDSKVYDNTDKESTEILIQEILKYSSLSKQISFIDIGLYGENNRIYLNNNKTNIYIPYEEIETLDKKLVKKEEIKNVIEEAIKKRRNGDILMISLSILDENVYKYAYDLVKETIDEAIEDYGEEKVLKGEFYLQSFNEAISD